MVMTAKIVAFILTLLTNVAIGVAVFAFMLLAMNGFSESDASYGLGAFIVLAILISLSMSAAATLTVHVLMRREFKGYVAGMIAVPLFSIVGGGLKIACGVIGVLIADYVRVNY